MADRGRAWAVWVVGLPGCGKSTLANGVCDYLNAQGHDVIMLEMDQRRKEYFPNPAYTAEERESAYKMFTDEAAFLVQQGKNVIMDGAAYMKSMRTYARQNIEHFAEIFVHCEFDEAVDRESQRPKGQVMAELYRKALERKLSGKQFSGLGEVIGVDVSFEVDHGAECIIDNTHLSVEETLGKALHFLDSWLPDA